MGDGAFFRFDPVWLFSVTLKRSTIVEPRLASLGRRRDGAPDDGTLLLTTPSSIREQERVA